ncbi:MAG TPA: hypothetical protein VN759_02380 [Pseudolysinimonas sp.]|nr:hypothetical protein [Pseudolysinimonas sp.]
MSVATVVNGGAETLLAVQDDEGADEAGGARCDCSPAIGGVGDHDRLLSV